jgi:hypothetical protein
MSRLTQIVVRALVCGLVCCGIPSVGLAQKLTKQQRQFLALTPADFERTMTVKDDALDTVARFSTENGYQEKHGLLGLASFDNFLRAWVDKKSGETTFQLYEWISYGGDWRFYDRINYETPDGPDSKAVTVIDRSVNGCSQFGCSFTEHLGFEVSEMLLRKIAASYDPVTPKAWHFKFNSKAGVEFQDGVNAAEIVAILSAVDRYRAAHRYTKASEGQPVSAMAAPPATAAASASPPAEPKQNTAKKPALKKPAVTCITCE